MKTKFNPDNLTRAEKNPEHYKWGLFYFNPNDTRIFVPKRAQWMGWTLNFANLWSYVILAGIVGFVILMGFIEKIKG
jgi:uncharacterized membrane protein